MSTQTHIRDSLLGVIEYYMQNPDQALSHESH